MIIKVKVIKFFLIIFKSEFRNEFIKVSVTTQPLNMEFLPQIAQIYADLKPPKVVYWRKLIKKDFILICDVCVICGKYLFMNSLNRLSSYKFLLFYCLYYSYLMLFVIIHIRVRFFFSFLLSKLYIKNNLLQL